MHDDAPAPIPGRADPDAEAAAEAAGPDQSIMVKGYEVERRLGQGTVGAIAFIIGALAMLLVAMYG